LQLPVAGTIMSSVAASLLLMVVSWGGKRNVDGGRRPCVASLRDRSVAEKGSEGAVCVCVSFGFPVAEDWWVEACVFGEEAEMKDDG
jgi:hypothetical protein